MSKHQASTETLIKRDLQTGGGRAFNRLVHEVTVRSGVGQDVFKQTGGDLVQLDIPDRKGATRVHLQRFGNSTSMSLWDVDTNGTPKGESYELMSYDVPEGRQTVLSGSSAGSLDGGDLRVSSHQMAKKNDSTIKVLKQNGFKIVVGNNVG